MLEIKSTKLEVDDFSSIKLARSDDTPFNQPGRKAATNRYVNTMLSMLDSSEAAKVINRAINSIYLNPSQVQKVAFFQQLKDPHGFLSGPAYSVIRQEVFDAYEGDFDSFLTDFNLKLLQNPEKDIYITGGFLIGIGKLYEEVHKSTPNFTDALEVYAPSPFCAIDKDLISFLERSFGTESILYRWNWTVKDHYLEDMLTHFDPQTVTKFLNQDALQTVSMACTLSKVYDTSSRSSFGIVVNENLENTTSKIIQNALEGRSNNDWYISDIAVPKQKGGSVRNALSYFSRAKKCNAHLIELANQLDLRLNQLNSQLIETQESAAEHREIADRLSQVIEYMKTFDKSYDQTLTKMLERAKKPRAVPDANIPRNSQLYSKTERKNSWIIRPKQLMDIQSRIIQYSAADEHLVEEISRLHNQATNNVEESKTWRSQLVSGVAAGIRQVKYSRDENQYSKFLQIIQNSDGYTYFHTLQVELAYVALHNFCRANDVLPTFAKLNQELVKKIAILHDIGKIGMYIGKPNEKFTLSQKRQIKEHTDLGQSILSTAGVEPEVIQTAYLHHENPVGKGYHNVQGTHVPSYVRAFIPCDVLSAVRSRAYQRNKPLDHLDALQELNAHSGTQFWSEELNLFTKALEKDTKFIDEFDELNERLARDS